MMTDKLLIDRELLERIRELMHIIAHRQDDYGVEAEYLGSLLTKAIAQPTKQGEAVEVVGMRIRTDGFGSYIADFAMGVPAAMPGEVREQLMTVAQHERILAAWQRTQAAWVPEAKVTGAWESARIGDFNAGWNACRDSVFTLMKKAAYMELDTTKRSIAIQDELRALLASVEGGE